MASLTYKLEKLEGRRRAGKRAVVKFADGAEYDFCGVMFGGTSPIVWLRTKGGKITALRAAEWRAMGAGL